MLEITKFQLSTYRTKDVFIRYSLFSILQQVLHGWGHDEGPRFYDTTLTISRKNDLRVEALKTKREEAKAGNSDLIGFYDNHHGSQCEKKVFIYIPILG